MKSPWGISLLSWLALTLAACGTDGGNPAAPANSVIVTGVVTHVDNQIAVDGGITLDLRLPNGQTDRVVFGGLFTFPPPDDRQLRLYEQVRQVEVGYLIRAQGERRNFGILLERLWILDDVL